MPPLESLTAPTAVPSSSISSSSTAPAVTVEPAGVGARTSESEVQRLRAEFSTLLTEMAALKQS